MGRWGKSLVVAFASWRCRVNRLEADRLHRKAWELWRPYRLYCAHYDRQACFYRQRQRMWEAMALSYMD